MKPFASIVLVAVFLLFPAVTVLAGSQDQGFDAVVKAIEGRYQVHAERMPLVAFLARVTGTGKYGGNLHKLATVEDFKADVDSEELTTLVDEKLGAGWARMVREVSHHGREATLVYVRPHGHDMDMFVVSSEGRELDIVELTAKPDALEQNVRKYLHDGSEADPVNAGD